MKLNKINLALGLLTIICIILAIQFYSPALALCSIVFAGAYLGRISHKVSVGNIVPSVESPTIGELLNEQLNDKAKNKLARMSGEEKNKLAHRFAHEIGSDTQPLTFKKHSITGDKV